MSESNTQQHHHHDHSHHHHHHMDQATKFKRESLNAIHRRKVIAKWLKRVVVGIAIIMGLLVIVAYTIG